MIDKVFSKKKEVIETFEFNEEVTQVFDDMITRSVPFYNEIHRIIVDIYKKIKFKDEVISFITLDSQSVSYKSVCQLMF